MRCKPSLPAGLLALAALLPAQQPDSGPPARSADQLRTAAVAAEQRGDFAAAVEDFLALARAEPDRPDWVIAAGRCLGRVGRIGDAIDLLEAGTKRFPEVLELPAMLARSLLLLAETQARDLHPEVLWAEAVRLAESVLATDPYHADARLIAAQGRHLLGDLDAAERHADEAIRRHPERSGAHILRGRFAADRFRALLWRLEREQPAAAERADLVAAIDRERRAARAAFQRAAALDHNRAHPHVALAELALLDGDRSTARAKLGDALVADPEASIDHDLLTEGLDWQASRDLYLALLGRATARGDLQARQLASLRFQAARASFRGGDHEAAAADFAAVLAGDPQAVSAHYYLFLCAYQQHDLGTAEQHAAAYAASGAERFATVVRGLPEHERDAVVEIVRHLADRAHAAGHLVASRDLNHVVAFLSDSADAWNNHAFLCRESGRFEDALRSYEYALQRQPDSPQLWNDAAVVLHYHLPTPEHLARARSMYDQALALAARITADPARPEAERQAAAAAAANAKANLAALD